MLGAESATEPKFGARQIALARAIYDETGPDGKRRYTVVQSAAEFGVTHPTIYRRLDTRPLTCDLPCQVMAP